MAEYRLDAGPETVTDVFCNTTPPVLTVDPGDTVVVRSLDCSGHLERQRVPGEERPTLLAGRRGHCLVGPIAVRGAAPGMALSVRLESLRPDAWGWTVAAAADSPLNRRLGLAGREPSWLLWELDADAGTGTNQYGHTVDLAPFLGVIGMPPPEPGEHSTVPPRVLGGGNIDCRELVAGATLFLPVTVPDALLCVGDGHAAQGDGEVSGTAVECGMTTRLTVGLETAPPVRTAHAVTPAGRITFGFDPDLNEASAQALDAMLEWMCALYGLERAAALALASTAVDLRVTQVANRTWGVHAVLRHTAVR
ncbi:acetamidase/formamidase family protein [Streptantibioticus silvisoli]|uniref:Acetamidase/formamidase family protein n=1 Tax=Streptantibioticus silvisoli TaxID=2705255 RepID=A0ABT6W711_9ACTN|nr:acetamidase/formamidase family protein [Streptantibioticus silvisoli]MDI5966094.1 acetamidase/formamidase family protein [Streptantibioticus silvisoli]